MSGKRKPVTDESNSVSKKERETAETTTSGSAAVSSTGRVRSYRTALTDAIAGAILTLPPELSTLIASYYAPAVVGIITDDDCSLLFYDIDELPRTATATGSQQMRMPQFADPTRPNDDTGFLLTHVPAPVHTAGSFYFARDSPGSLQCWALGTGPNGAVAATELSLLSAAPIEMFGHWGFDVFAMCALPAGRMLCSIEVPQSNDSFIEGLYVLDPIARGADVCLDPILVRTSDPRNAIFRDSMSRACAVSDSVDVESTGEVQALFQAVANRHYTRNNRKAVYPTTRLGVSTHRAIVKLLPFPPPHAHVVLYAAYCDESQCSIFGVFDTETKKDLARSFRSKRSAACEIDINPKYTPDFAFGRYESKPAHILSRSDDESGDGGGDGGDDSETEPDYDTDPQRAHTRADSSMIVCGRVKQVEWWRSADSAGSSDDLNSLAVVWSTTRGSPTILRVGGLAVARPAGTGTGSPVTVADWFERVEIGLPSDVAMDDTSIHAFDSDSQSGRLWFMHSASTPVPRPPTGAAAGAVPAMRHPQASADPSAHFALHRVLCWTPDRNVHTGLVEWNSERVKSFRRHCDAAERAKLLAAPTNAQITAKCLIPIGGGEHRIVVTDDWSARVWDLSHPRVVAEADAGTGDANLYDSVEIGLPLERTMVLHAFSHF